MPFETLQSHWLQVHLTLSSPGLFFLGKNYNILVPDEIALRLTVRWEIPVGPSPYAPLVAIRVWIDNFWAGHVTLLMSVSHSDMGSVTVWRNTGLDTHPLVACTVTITAHVCRGLIMYVDGCM